MREVLVSDRIATAAAGRELSEIGALLSAGRVDDALARVDAVRARYPEWAELDQAIANAGACDYRERTRRSCDESRPQQFAEGFTRARR